MDTKEFTGIISAAKSFFGLLEGQSLQDFAAEWNKLTDADKAEIRAGLEKLGYVIKNK